MQLLEVAFPRWFFHHFPIVSLLNSCTNDRRKLKERQLQQKRTHRGGNRGCPRPAKTPTAPERRRDDDGTRVAAALAGRIAGLPRRLAVEARPPRAAERAPAVISLREKERKREKPTKRQRKERSCLFVRLFLPKKETKTACDFFPLFFLFRPRRVFFLSIFLSLSFLLSSGLSMPTAAARRRSTVPSPCLLLCGDMHTR